MDEEDELEESPEEIAVIIQDNMFDDLDKELDLESLEEFSDQGCPVCGGDNIIQEGRCTTCMDCGWSKCSI